MGEGGAEGVPHCRYESKWRRQEERRIIAVAYSATALCTDETTALPTRRTSERERERGRDRERERDPSSPASQPVTPPPPPLSVSQFKQLHRRSVSELTPISNIPVLLLALLLRSAPDAAPAGAPGAPGAPGADGAPAGGPPAPPNTSSNRRLQQTQAQVEEVVDIMRVNVDKVLERDQKLSELDDRADALQAGASQFESCAAKLKNKYWWKNCKMMIMMGIIGVIVVGIIFCE
ncbi:Synaptobrevin [Nibea albiflora]|uniref:Synaptobrevin n=1 Tax=Nibea albiflora TaxID=240163 RepID=A0ACB7F6M8_NIBAL|nr:Synaptobrevin [Nibea albiflora]